MTTISQGRRGGFRRKHASFAAGAALCGLVFSVIPAFLSASAQAADVTSSFTWNPVRLGAGGFITGFVTHPLNPAVRYCRTDVGNAYRWDNTNQQWVPMVVHNQAAPTGIPAANATAPGIQGVASIAVDPSNTSIVYLATTFPHSNDVTAIFPNIPGNVYRSNDGGQTFTAGDLNTVMVPNDSNYRYLGERLAVDSHNGNVLYYGSATQGLWRSINGGAHWAQVTASGAPGSTVNIIGVRIAPTDGTSTLSGLTVSKSVYLVSGNVNSSNQPVGGQVFKSSDGGNSWSTISSGSGVDGVAGDSTVGPDGSFYVSQIFTTTLWKYSGGSWSSANTGGEIDSVGIDPNNSNTIYTEGGGGQLHRSVNGMAGPWVYLGSVGTQSQYGGTFAWLPQQDGFRSTSGVVVDTNGTVWIPEGNEGVVRCQPTASSSASNLPSLTIDSKGIEEFVTTDISIPKGGGGNTIVTMEDGTGFVLGDLSQFTAQHVPLSTNFLNAGTSVAFCPNASSYLALVTTDVFYTVDGKCHTGYSTNGGTSWQQFGSLPYIPEQSRVVGTDGYGTIAVSARGAWGTGSDHLVWLPGNSLPPYYSKDGGNTWTRTGTFPLTSSGTMNGYTGIWSVALRQHQVRADPFVPDRYYMNLVGGGFFISTDGGVTWVNQPNAAIPLGDHHGNLEVNYAIQNDLWFVDGWEGAYGGHGLFHSTNGGQTFSQISGIDYAITVSLGAGSGNSGDQPYTVYFYGKITGDNNWGVFRSTNGGTSWDRISYYPTGIFDWPTCMAASWDTYGKVVVGFSGNSFVYSTFGGTVSPPVITTGGPPIGHRIALKSNISGYYVSSDQNNQTFLTAGFATSPSTWEYFDVVDAGNGNIALWCEITGHYVTVDIGASNDVLLSNWGTTIGNWEPLTWQTNSDGSISLKSVANGLYVSCNMNDSDLLEAEWATTAQTWEDFTLTDLGTGGTAPQAQVASVRTASATPAATPAATGSTKISIAEPTGGATIRYTTDGTTPTTTHGTVYTGPFTMTGSSLMAIGYMTGWKNSSVTSYSIPVAPVAPSGLKATAGAAGTKKIALTWTALSGATSYKVYRSVSSGAYSLLSTSTTASYTDSGLTAGTTYAYEISAVNSAGEGAKSAAVSAKAQ